MITMNKPISEQERIEQIIGSAELLHAYIECSDALQLHAKKMIQALASKEADDEDRYHAAIALLEILQPYFNENDKLYGMDLEEADKLLSNHNHPSGHPVAVDCDESAKILRDMDSQESAFAERLGALMQKRGISQSELASRIGVGQPAIAMMLKRNCRPQKRTLSRLAEALEVDVSELWTEIGRD